MKNLELLANVVEYIEIHLQEELKVDEIAEACFCSKSTLDKLFRTVFHISVKDYIIRRRMTKAAKNMLEHPERTLIDIAFEYGYASHEAFTRAFKQIWNCSPSEYRESARAMELFPRMELPLENGDLYMSERRHFDISELYDLFQSRSNCYFVCCDIRSLIPINDISYKAGDLAILESMNRMERAAGEEDLVFRIGGDEFAMLTCSEEKSYAEKIVQDILSHNGDEIDFEGRKIPLYLHVGIGKWDRKPLKYNELFTGLHHIIFETKPEN